MTESASKVRIAAAQYPLDQFAAFDAYVEKQARWIADAAVNGAQLLVFPEYGAMELAAPDAVACRNLEASLAATSQATERVLPHLRDLAQKHRVHILATSGPWRIAPGRYVNRAHLISPSGHIGHQDKLIMTPFETDWGIEPGTHNRVFETTIGRIGIAICYDSEFPLIVRAQCEAGADIILIPSCTEFPSGNQRVRTAAMARALENGCVTVQAPTVGAAPWSPAVDFNTGIAGIFAPSEHGLSDTGIVAEGTLNTPQWVYGDADLDHLRRVRASGEMRNSLDWPRQQGAAPLSIFIEIVDLT